MGGLDACVALVLELAEMERSGFEQRELVGLSKLLGRCVPLEEHWVGKESRPGEEGETRGGSGWVGSEGGNMGWKKGLW